MFNFWRSKSPIDLLTSDLFDEKTFYQDFIKDLENCNEEVIIESPFITNYRAQQLRPIFQKLVNRGVKVYIMTRPPEEHDENLRVQAEGELGELELMGVQVLLCVGNHHRKLAILDRRIESKQLTMQLFNFLKLNKII